MQAYTRDDVIFHEGIGEFTEKELVSILEEDENFFDSFKSFMERSLEKGFVTPEEHEKRMITPYDILRDDIIKMIQEEDSIAMEYAMADD